MEYYIFSVKQMRNDVFHKKLESTEEDLLKKTERLRKVLSECLKSSGERFMQDQDVVDREIKRVNDNLDHITQNILGEEDIMSYCRDDIKQYIIKDSCDRLKNIFQSISNVNPLSFITSDLQLKIDKIFVDIEVKHGKRTDEGKHIDHQDLLQLIQPTASSSFAKYVSELQIQTTASPSPTVPKCGITTRPQILLLEGLAGSGKTTLMQLVIDEWINGDRGNINGLNDYELLLWVQCRDPTMNSYQDLLDRLMPDVSLKFRNILPRMMKLCRILIIIDGLDEDNKNSKDLVISLLHEFNCSSNIAFLCTSRPEKVENFRKVIPHQYAVIHASLHGISKQNLPLFVRLNHQEITKQTRNNRDTEELVRNVTKLKGLYEHLKLPLNLIFMIYIWDNDPDKLSIMSVTHTELVHIIHQLCTKKLMERLIVHEDTKNLDDSDLENKVEEILREIYKTSLESLSRDQLSLEEKTVNYLKSSCKSLGLPHKEILSAFLCLKPTWTLTGIKEQYSAPHKGIQDYFAARYIVVNLNNDLQHSTSTPVSLAPVSIREVLKQTLRAVTLEITKYQNVLVHVAGLVHLLLDQVPKDIAQQIVELLHESGMKNNSHWFDLLENTKISPEIVQEIANFISPVETIYISDSNVRSYAALLPYLTSSKVVINIFSDTADLPCLPNLLAGLDNHHCTELTLDHPYHHSETTTPSDDVLQRIQNKSYLKEFMGYLSGDGLAMLPPSVEKLDLAIGNDAHALHFLPRLSDAVTSALPELGFLCVRVPAGISSEILVPLPKTQMAVLHLSDVCDAGVNNACEMVQLLQPAGG
nr:NACHT, LRR and PYD domains-containing protein 10-like [Cherax quadricarinatus]